MRSLIHRAKVALVPLLIVLASAFAPISAVAYPDSFQGRLEVLALIQSLNAELLSHDSATQTLTRWCAVHRLASPARIVARRARATDKPADAQVRAILAAEPGEPVRYRHVELACGRRVLSSADNWYRPGRLTEAMNRALAQTSTPFGVVVGPLGFRRRTLDSTLLFKPLPDDWQARPRPPARGGSLVIPQAILRQRAVLETPDGQPFSLVVETYTRALLGGDSERKPELRFH